MKLSKIETIENNNLSNQVPSLSNVNVVQNNADKCENQSFGDFPDIETEINAINASHEDLDHLNLAYLNLDSE